MESDGFVWCEGYVMCLCGTRGVCGSVGFVRCDGFVWCEGSMCVNDGLMSCVCVCVCARPPQVSTATLCLPHPLPTSCCPQGPAPREATYIYSPSVPPPTPPTLWHHTRFPKPFSACLGILVTQPLGAGSQIMWLCRVGPRGHGRSLAGLAGAHVFLLALCLGREGLCVG